MRKIAILAAVVLPVVFVLAFAASAFAVSPHTGYGAGGTDFCISCHDIHEASGDYVLTRQATVTALCGTCHGIFGNPAPADPPNWGGNNPTDFAGTNPTTSTLLAYKVNMAPMTAAQMDAVPGHSLGVMYGGTVVRNLDTMPGSSATLKVMTTGQYGGPTEGLYGGTSVTTFNGTKGLYCASCHTPHAEWGQAIVGTPKMLSALPNHGTIDPVTGLQTATPAVDELSFCISCHDKRDNVGAENNHPSSYCLTCHANAAGDTDFPHTGTNYRILQMPPDALCVACHQSGTLP